MRISDWSSDVCSSDLEPPHRQYVTLWCKAQPFDDCHRIVIARRQAWGAVWNIRHLISLRRKQHCQLACQGRRYSDHAMGPDQRRTLTEAKSEFGKRAPFRALVIRTMMRDNNMEAQDAGQGAQQSRPDRKSKSLNSSELQSLMRTSYAVFCLK